MTAANAITGETRDKIVSMLAMRPPVSIKRIAAFYNVSRITVERIAHANGFTNRGRPL
jgi:DeoR/GlpR family transcriptional regulator of sugar metabolism